MACQERETPLASNLALPCFHGGLSSDSLVCSSDELRQQGGLCSDLCALCEQGAIKDLRAVLRLVPDDGEAAAALEEARRRLNRNQVSMPKCCTVRSLNCVNR